MDRRKFLSVLPAGVAAPHALAATAAPAARDPRYADRQQHLWNRMQEMEAQIPERPRIEPKKASG